jgi:hypothetical protein
MQGAVVGTPGTYPTNWSQSQNTTLIPAVVGTGYEDGMAYIDIRLVGSSVGGNNNLFFDGNTAIPAAVGQAWAQSVYLRLIGGSWTGVNSVVMILGQRDSGGASLGDLQTYLGLPTSASLSSQRFTNLKTVTHASTAYLRPSLQINPAGGGTSIDVTVRIGLPQLEQGTAPTSGIATIGTAAYGPRFDYDPTNCPSGVCVARGILLEPARTNSLTYSGAIGGTDWGSLNGGTLTLNAALAPDGTMTATQTTEDTSNVARYFSHTAVTGVVNAKSWSFSVYAKPHGRSSFNLVIFSSVDASNKLVATFNLTGAGTGSASSGGTASGASTSIEALANGWYRCILKGQPDTSGTGFTYWLYPSPSGPNAYVGDGASGLYFWGAQAEAGPSATSYIATGSAAASRAIDDLGTSTSDATWYNAVTGTMVAKFRAGALPTGLNLSVAGFYYDTTNSDLIDIFAGNGVTDVMRATASSVNNVYISNHFSFTTDAVNTAGVSWVENGFSQTANGGTVVNSTATQAIPSNITVLKIGTRNFGGVSPLGGWMQTFDYYGSRLSDAQLKYLTAP